MKWQRGMNLESTCRAVQLGVEAVMTADLCRIRVFRCRARGALFVGKVAASFPPNDFVEVFIPERVPVFQGKVLCMVSVQPAR